MNYRKFGNTGIEISQLGFGAMRLPEFEMGKVWFVDEEKSIEMIQRGFDLGINFIDTAWFYSHNNSEYVVGKALKGYRDKVYLSSKCPMPYVEKKGDYRRFLEMQLKRLDQEYIDFYHYHGLNLDVFENKVLKLDLINEAMKATEEGLIKHISFSFHDKPENMKPMIDTGIFASVLLQYNLLDRSNEEMIKYANENGLGVVCMGPVGGGRLGYKSDKLSKMFGGIETYELALRFVLGNENVSCALSGMGTIDMVEANVNAVNKKQLTKQEMEKIEIMAQATKKLADLYCTGCSYCMPCPQGINIPGVFQTYIKHMVYGLSELAKNEYSAYVNQNGSVAEKCIECGQCEPQCPQSIKIIEKLKLLDKELTSI